MKIIVLVNGAAGSVAGQAERIAAITQAFASAGAAAEIRAVPPLDLRAAADLAAASADIVVAAGGDGTASTVAGALVHRDAVLGVLPLGTLNHFAKDLGLPLDLTAAIETIVRGIVRHVDVGEVEGHVFINNSSIGIYPAIVRDRDKQRLAFGRRKWFAMALATLRVFRRFPLLTVRLMSAGQSLRRTTPFVFVGNNHYEFNLLALGARKRLDEGQLALYIANCRSRFALVRLLLRAALGRLQNSRDFEAHSLSELTVDTRRRQLSVAIDGEVVRLQPPISYRSRPLALKVMAPSLPA